MPGNRWIDTTQPQTLMIAVILLYLNAGLGMLTLLTVGTSHLLLFVLLTIGQVAAGFGIANEKKWGYGLGIVVAVAPIALQLFYFHIPIAPNLINLLFEVALVALLLHPQSREYQRIWFK